MRLVLGLKKKIPKLSKMFKMFKMIEISNFLKLGILPIISKDFGNETILHSIYIFNK